MLPLTGNTAHAHVLLTTECALNVRACVYHRLFCQIINGAFFGTAPNPNAAGAPSEWPEQFEAWVDGFRDIWARAGITHEEVTRHIDNQAGHGYVHHDAAFRALTPPPPHFKADCLHAMIPFFCLACWFLPKNLVQPPPLICVVLYRAEERLMYLEHRPELTTDHLMGQIMAFVLAAGVFVPRRRS